MNQMSHIAVTILISNQASHKLNLCLTFWLMLKNCISLQWLNNIFVQVNEYS